MALLAPPPFLYISTTSGAFLVVVKGYDTKDGLPEWQSRSCVGFRYSPKVNHGLFYYCVGMPYGPWMCHRTFNDGTTLHEPCR